MPGPVRLTPPPSPPIHAPAITAATASSSTLQYGYFGMQAQPARRPRQIRVRVHLGRQLWCPCFRPGHVSQLPERELPPSSRGGAYARSRLPAAGRWPALDGRARRDLCSARRARSAVQNEPAAPQRRQRGWPDTAQGLRVPRSLEQGTCLHAHRHIHAPRAPLTVAGVICRTGLMHVRTTVEQPSVHAPGSRPSAAWAGAGALEGASGTESGAWATRSATSWWAVPTWRA